MGVIPLPNPSRVWTVTFSLELPNQTGWDLEVAHFRESQRDSII